MKAVTDRAVASGLVGFLAMCFGVSGVVHFETGNYWHTVAAWALAGLLYMTWRQVRWRRN